MTIFGQSLAPGIFLFDSHRPGPRRLYSAGIHGDEVEGQRVVQAVLADLQSGKVTVESGSVMIVLANLAAIEDKKRVSGDGQDFNRSFHAETHPRIVEIKKWVTTFKPTLHRDIHSTIHEVPFAFALCSRRAAQLKEDFYDFALRYSLTNIVQFVYTADRALTTFAGYTAQHFGAESFTVELGHIGGSRARRMVPKMITAIFSEIAMRPLKQVVPTVELWKMGKKITKQTEEFRFTRKFENFAPLTEGEVIAHDANMTWSAPPNGALLFANDTVPVGGRAGVFISKQV